MRKRLQQIAAFYTTTGATAAVYTEPRSSLRFNGGLQFYPRDSGYIFGCAIRNANFGASSWASIKDPLSPNTNRTKASSDCSWSDRAVEETASLHREGVIA